MTAGSVIKGIFFLSLFSNTLATRGRSLSIAVSRSTSEATVTTSWTFSFNPS